MFYTGSSNAKKCIPNDKDFFKTEYEEYYNSLSQEELSPLNILACSALTNDKHNAFEKILLIYVDKIIVLKKVNGSISKYPIEYGDINYIVMVGHPHPVCMTIQYKKEGREKIYFDDFAEEVVNSMVNDLRRHVAGNKTCNKVVKSYSINEDESDYIGKTLADGSLFENQKCICNLEQKRVYDRYWSIFRKVTTQTHYSVVSNDEIVIFIEKYEPCDEKDICGDLVYISLKSLKRVSLETTERGMIMKYMFKSKKIFELYYQNERTDELLKAMAFMNGVIQS